MHCSFHTQTLCVVGSDGLKNNLTFLVVRTNKKLAPVLFSGQTNVRYFYDEL